MNSTVLADGICHGSGEAADPALPPTSSGNSRERLHSHYVRLPDLAASAYVWDGTFA